MWSGFGFIAFLCAAGVLLWLCEICLGLDLDKVQKIATILGLSSIPIAIWAFEFKKHETRKETALKLRSEFVDFMGEWTHFLGEPHSDPTHMDQVFRYRYFLERLDLICMKILTNGLEREEWALPIASIVREFVNIKIKNLKVWEQPALDIDRLFPNISKFTSGLTK